MQYNAKTPEEYMSLLEADWRKERVEELRSMLKRLGPKLIESIEYKVLAYGNGTKNIFHLNAQKAYVSLYVGNIDKVPDARALLKEFDMGKGCIRIKKKIKLSETKLDFFITKVLNTWNSGGNTDC